MLNGLDKGFALIGVTIIRSNRWWHPMKTPFLLCCLPFGLRFQLRPNKSGKPMTPHLLRYQDLAVDDYSCGLDALDLRYPRLLQH